MVSLMAYDLLRPLEETVRLVRRQIGIHRISGTFYVLQTPPQNSITKFVSESILVSGNVG